jgi:hypothetical protein
LCLGEVLVGPKELTKTLDNDLTCPLGATRLSEISY